MVWKMDLGGQWNVWLGEEKDGVPYRMTLPGTTAEAKLGSRSTERAEGYLTEYYHYEGCAWFEREFTLPDAGWAEAGAAAEDDAPIYAERGISRETGKQECLPTEGGGYGWWLRLERTRISEAWLDGHFVGRQDSLTTSHWYDLTDWLKESGGGTHRLAVAVRNVGYKAPGGHMTSQDTQTNWNGIVGEIALYRCGGVRIAGIHVSASADRREIALRLCLDCRRPGQHTAALSVTCGSGGLTGEDGDSYAETHDIRLREGENQADLVIKLPDGFPVIPWNEFTPRLYPLKITVTEEGRLSDSRFLRVGFRDLRTDADSFYLNDLPVFLRGKQEAMTFPLTGYAPMDQASWRRIFATARSYGLNHYRFHTCCPPEAAFEAADELGMYLEPEIPFWGTMAAPGEPEYDRVRQEYLYQEGLRMLAEFGNHPSFLLFSLGNELWGSPAELNRILGEYKALDSRHWYTQGSNNFQFAPVILENEDFFCGVRFSRERLFRGSYAMSDAPQGHVQLTEPENAYDYDAVIRPDLAKVGDGGSGSASVLWNEGEGNVPADGRGRDIPLVGDSENIPSNEGRGSVLLDGSSENVSPDESNGNELSDGSGGSVPLDRDGNVLPDEGRGSVTQDRDGVSVPSDGIAVEIQFGTGTKIVRAERSAEKELIPRIPVVSHEIGQYAVYPDYREIDRYTGVVGAENFKIFRERLTEKGMGRMAHKFFLASGHLSAQCYKRELETAFRSRHLAGFQLLDLEDFPGQGSALVGMLNAFMESKGLIEPETWRQFCGDRVLMLSFPRYVYRTGEMFRFRVLMYNGNPARLPDEGLILRVRRRERDRPGNRPGAGMEFIWNEIDMQEIPVRVPGLTRLSCLYEGELRLPEAEQPEICRVSAELAGSGIRCEYDIYIYPEDIRADASRDEKRDAPLVTSDAEQMLAALAAGGRVLYLGGKPGADHRIEAAYCTDFWDYPMFRSISDSMGRPRPIGTLGMYIENSHRALRYFPSEDYTTPQWWKLLRGAYAAVLDGTEVEPIVWMIDNVERNHRLGMIYEARVGRGRLLACQFPLNGGSPEEKWMYRSLLDYAGSSGWQPTNELTQEQLRRIYGG